LASVPFFGMCFSVALWDRLEPHVLGLPFNLFWIVAWNAFTPAVLLVIYRIERHR
jgi:hypothetical protein